MKTIALATFNNISHSLQSDFNVLKTHLSSLNIEVEMVQAVWNDPEIDWLNYDLVVIDTTWDYHRHPQLFRKWLKTLKELKIPTINPIPLIEWNMSKSYLFEIQRNGFRIPKSLVISKSDSQKLIHQRITTTFEEISNPFLIVKPLISASSFRTGKINYPLTSDSWEHITEIIQDEDLLVQAYVSEILEGEYSIIFISGNYTHAMIKIPKSGEFRSQEEFGGEVKLVNPPPRLIDLADRLLDSLPYYPVYARVDVVFDGVSGIVMECELIEPFLFLYHSTKATSLLLQAILSRIEQTY